MNNSKPSSRATAARVIPAASAVRTASAVGADTATTTGALRTHARRHSRGAIERARRLSPLDLHLAAQRFEQAAEWANRAVHDQPRLASAVRLKVGALAYLGNLDEARAELCRLLAIDPKATITGYAPTPLTFWRRKFSNPRSMACALLACRRTEWFRSRTAGRPAMVLWSKHTGGKQPLSAQSGHLSNVR